MANDSPRRLNEDSLLKSLDQLQSADSLDGLRRRVVDLKRLTAPLERERRPDASTDGNTQDGTYLAQALDQIAAAQTLGRARYYIRRLIKGLTQVRTSRVNDINLNRWQEYGHIGTDSLWIIARRDSSGVHTANYWGNFVPQIPRQMMLRYTKESEWVLDPFAGAGTTLIEGQRLGRNTIGIELQPDVAARARQLVASEPNEHGVVREILVGDSRTLDYRAVLERFDQRSVQLVIMHPPYFDIIQFSNDSRDLSNAASVQEFLTGLGAVIHKTSLVLDPGRFLILVIGDKYSAGEWIPLGFLTMNEVLQRGFTLKSIVVKNVNETTGKRSQQALWRYRALAGGFYIFKHEYVFIFEKQ